MLNFIWERGGSSGQRRELLTSKSQVWFFRPQFIKSIMQKKFGVNFAG